MFSGGVISWILIALAVVAVCLFFERFMDLRRAQIDYQDFLKGVINVLDSGSDDEAISICEEASVPVAQVVSAAIRHRRDDAQSVRNAVDAQGRTEIGRLDRRLATLAIIGQIAPLLGLLGTVIGFIRVVMAANAQAVVARADLLNGSMEALVSTALGLAVAILSVVMYGALRVRLDRTVVELEAAANVIVGYVTRDKVSGK